MIFSGRLQAEDRIQTQQLSTDWAVSRTPMRDAIWRLSTEGLLEVRPRVGVYVRKISIEEAFEVHRIKRALEPLMASWAAERGELEERRALHGSMVLLHGAADRHDVVEYVELLEGRRQAMLAAGRSRVLADQFKGIDGRIRLIRFRNLGQPNVLSQSVAEHQRIADAILAGDATAAFDAMSYHMLQAENRMIRAWKRIGSADRRDVPGDNSTNTGNS